MKLNINSFGGRLFIGFLIVTVIIVSTLFFTKKHLLGVNIETLENWVTIAEWLAAAILLLIIVSLLRQYKHGHDIHGDEDSAVHKKKTLHHHRAFSGTTIFIATIVGLIYTFYSDVFFQHGDPLTPVLYGLVDNKTIVDLDKDIERKDTTHLIFILDVSSSTKNCVPIDKSWVIIAKKSIENQFKNESKIAAVLKKMDGCSGLDLIKLKTCQMLIKDRQKIIDDTVNNYRISILSFGEHSDLDDEKIDIRDRDKFEKVLSNILELKYSEHTYYTKIFTKLTKFYLVRENGDKFNLPKNVITILSDFLTDDGQLKDEGDLSSLLYTYAELSTFFNLVKVPISSKGADSPHSVLDTFKHIIHKELINIVDINHDINLLYGFYIEKEEITYIFRKPFHIDSCFTSLRLSSSDSISFLLAGAEDPRQQFKLHEERLRFNKSYNIVAPGASLDFSGRVPSQFSNISANFSYPKYYRTVSREIIFKKGLSPFVASVIFSLFILTLVISISYLFYFVLDICTSLKIKKKQDVVVPVKVN